MLFKRISRASAEVAYIVAKNVSGSTMTAGYHCVFDVGASADGVRVTQASTADLNAYAGIADSDIANNDYGLLQVYGYRSSAYIYSSAGSSVAGTTYNVINGEWGVTPTAAGASSAVAKAFGFMAAAVTASSSSQFHTTAAVFVRAL
jgi:hypothetical protein